MMKNLLRLTTLLLPAALLCACNKHLEYDTTDGIDYEMTLFQEGITVPLGSTEEITLGHLLDMASKTLKSLGVEINKETDGTLYVQSGEIFSYADAYMILLSFENPDVDNVYTVNYISGQVGGVSGAVGILGFNLKDQSVEFKMVNPIFADVTMDAHLKMTCTVTDWSTWSSTTTFTHEKDFSAVPLARTSSQQTLYSLALPDAAQVAPSFTLTDVKLHLPGGFGSKINTSPNCYFALSYAHKAHLCTGDREILTSLISAIPLNNLDIPLAQFGLQQCELALTLSNSLPIELAVTKVEPLDKGGNILENVVVNVDFTVAGGSLEKPATSDLKLGLESIDNGPIPDISGLKLHFKAKGAPGFSDVPLSVKQGVSVKSARASIYGGITLFGNQDEGGKDNE